MRKTFVIVLILYIKKTEPQKCRHRLGSHCWWKSRGRMWTQVSLTTGFVVLTSMLHICCKWDHTLMSSVQHSFSLNASCVRRQIIIKGACHGCKKKMHSPIDSQSWMGFSNHADNIYPMQPLSFFSSLPTEASTKVSSLFFTTANVFPGNETKLRIPILLQIC